MTRVCTQCNEAKPLERYYRNNGRPMAVCKDCHCKSDLDADTNANARHHLKKRAA